MSAIKVRPPFLTSLYNHNPFYAVSTVLMLFAVRNAYGELTIGTINCWVMMGVLAAYTALLAAIGVLIVRHGKVWEDARSIPLLLIILFLAVSISADDLFVKMESTAGGGLLLLCGYIFSAVVTEAFLRGARIRLGGRFRVPLHLFLALFYVAPWWCSPELHPRSAGALEWTIFFFPVAAAVLILALLPAVRRGPGYAADNGTPWRWPWFPWTAFGVIVGAVAMRTFALCMTFGPSGPIWVPLSGGRLAISFDTMWGPYFLIPPALAVLVLLLESGLVTKNHRLVRRVMFAVPLLLVLSVPISNGLVFRGFLHNFTDALGSPVWLAVWLQGAFYAWAWLRRASGAGLAALATLALLSIVGPQTLDVRTLTEPQSWPLFVIGLTLLIGGLRARSSWIMTASCTVLTLAVWLVLPETPLSSYRMTVSYHLLWASVVVLGLIFRDRLADVLRIVGAVQMPLASLIVLVGPRAAEVPINWRLAYVVTFAVVCMAIAKIWRSRWYLYAFTSLLAIAGYGATVLGFRGAVALLGRTATTSFAWSIAALLLAILISAQKAHWLPPRLFPRWGNGRGGSGPAGVLDTSIEPSEQSPDPSL